MLRFNVMDIHERPPMAMTLSTGYTRISFILLWDLRKVLEYIGGLHGLTVKISTSTHQHVIINKTQLPESLTSKEEKNADGLSADLAGYVSQSNN